MKFAPEHDCRLCRKKYLRNMLVPSVCRAFKGKLVSMKKRKSTWTQSRKDAGQMLTDKRKQRLKGLDKREVCARMRKARADKLKAARLAELRLPDCVAS